MKILRSIVAEKKDIVKASVTPNICNSIKDKPFKMTGAVIYTKEEEQEDGTIKDLRAVAIKASNGEFYTSISPTIISSVESIIEAYDEEEIRAGVEIVIKGAKANSGREFLFADMV